MNEITIDVAARVLEVVDAGLVAGLGVAAPGLVAAAEEAASASASAAWAEAELSFLAEGMAQILIDMNVPGVAFLPLTEATQ